MCSLFFDRFVLEQLVLDKHVRYILVIYPVVIWALSGNLDKNYDAETPTLNGIFIGKTLKDLKKCNTNIRQRLQNPFTKSTN